MQPLHHKLLVLLAVLVLAGCGAPDAGTPDADTPLPTARVTQPRIGGLLGESSGSTDAAELRAYGDMDGDGREDVAILRAVQRPNSRAEHELVAVLDHAGLPQQIAALPLGADVIVRALRVEAGQIVLDLDTLRQIGPLFYPEARSQRIYTLRSGQLALASQTDAPLTGEDLPEPQPAPQPVTFASSATSALFQQTITRMQLHEYMLHAEAGQQLTLSLASPRGDVWLAVRNGATPLVSVLRGVTAWTGSVPSSGDYVIEAAPTGGDTTAYTLYVALQDAPLPTAVLPTLAPTPTLPPVPRDDGPVVYLTFDDGPNPQWTPRVLDLLARYNAHATFFVIGRSAAGFPGLVQTEQSAGHGVGNHTYDHVALSGISRENFVWQVHQTQAAVPGIAACLRPPYGAIDGLGRAYAAEMGLQVVMWSVDPGDWRRPGASQIAAHVVSRVRPGSVVLMHDGGGDRSQTVAALETILQTLSAQGYHFAALCR